MIPRMRFSIKSKFLAAARVKHKRREKCDHNSDVNHVQHNFFIQTGKRHHGQSRNDATRSEEHTSELQSPCNLVSRLLLAKKTPSSEDSTQAASPDPEMQRYACAPHV